MITTSTAVLVRLLCKQEGMGYMLSVPGVLPELARRVCMDDDLVGYDHFKRSGKRILVLVDPVTMAIAKDLKAIPVEDLRRDRVGLHEVLMRLAVSNWDLNPISREEMAYLQEAIQDGPWSKGLLMIGEIP